MTRVHNHVQTSDLDEARGLMAQLYPGTVVECSRSGPLAYEGSITRSGPFTCVTGNWLNGILANIAELQDQYVLMFSRASAGVLDGSAGRAEMVSGRSAILMSSGQSGTFLSEHGLRTRTLAVDRGALDAQFAALTGHTFRTPLLFAPAVDLARGHGLAIEKVVDLFWQELGRPEASTLWLATLSDTVLTALVTGQEHSLSSWLMEPAPRSAPASVRRAEEYMTAHAAESIRLADIAAAAGVPARTLQAAFKAFRGMAPLDFLRQRRFDLAQAALVNPTLATSVAGVAMATGFGKPGRFATDYKKRFGESPSATLAKSRARHGLLL
jgi:AraC-like DNA-binding protein